VGQPPCEKLPVVEFKGVKTGPNLAESSKEGCGSKRYCFAIDDEYWRVEIELAFELIFVVNCHKNEFYNYT
jgi:hypothetical protein